MYIIVVTFRLCYLQLVENTNYQLREGGRSCFSTRFSNHLCPSRFELVRRQFALILVFQVFANCWSFYKYGISCIQKYGISCFYKLNIKLNWIYIPLFGRALLWFAIILLLPYSLFHWSWVPLLASYVLCKLVIFFFNFKTEFNDYSVCPINLQEVLDIKWVQVDHVIGWMNILFISVYALIIVLPYSVSWTSSEIYAIFLAWCCSCLYLWMNVKGF